jgi:hypothetical protein
MTDINNILLKVAGKPFRCSCGCNVFHHPKPDEGEEVDDDIYICNACETEYSSAEDD